MVEMAGYEIVGRVSSLLTKVPAGNDVVNIKIKNIPMVKVMFKITPLH